MQMNALLVAAFLLVAIAVPLVGSQCVWVPSLTSTSVISPEQVPLLQALLANATLQLPVMEFAEEGKNVTLYAMSCFQLSVAQANVSASLFAAANVSLCLSDLLLLGISANLSDSSAWCRGSYTVETPKGPPQHGSVFMDLVEEYFDVGLQLWADPAAQALAANLSSCRTKLLVQNLNFSNPGLEAEHKAITLSIQKVVNQLMCPTLTSMVDRLLNGVLAR